MPHDRFGIWRDKYGRRVCGCGGYWFPHRKGGGACDHSKTRDICLAKRFKDPVLLLDALVEHALTHGGETTDVCPF